MAEETNKNRFSKYTYLKWGTFNRFGGIGPENKLFATFLNQKKIIINYSKLLNLALWLESKTKKRRLQIG